LVRNEKEKSWAVVAGPYPIPLDILDANTVVPPMEEDDIVETVQDSGTQSVPVSSQPVS